MQVIMKMKMLRLRKWRWERTMYDSGHHLKYSVTYSAAAAKSLQSCPTLSDPIDCSEIRTKTLEA